MASSNIKFSNNAQSLSFTASDVQATGNETQVTSLPGYAGSNTAGKTIDQIELLTSQGGNQRLLVKAPGAGHNDKSCVSPSVGNNIINYPEPINIDSLSVVLEIL